MADSGDTRSITSRGIGRGRGRRDRSGSRPGVNSSSAVSGASNVTASLGGVSAASMASSMTPIPASTTGSTIASSTVTKTSASSGPPVEFALRPDLGKVGRPIELRTNNFKVTINGSLCVHQYRVEIASDGFDRKLKRDDHYLIFWEAMKEYITAPYTVAYDGGNNCYALVRLAIPSGEIKTSLQMALPRFGRKSNYVFKITELGHPCVDFTAKDAKSRQTALAVLDMVYRQVFNSSAAEKARERFYPFGRSFFHYPTPGSNMGFDLDSGRQVWSGYFFAAKLGFGMVPILNIDVSNGVFYKRQSVLQYLCDILNQTSGGGRYRIEELERLQQPYHFKPMEISMFNRYIKGCFVCTTSAPHRRQKVHCVTDKAADKLMFECREIQDGAPINRQISVAEYFATKYNKPLRYPFFPCLQIGTKKPAYLPLEICDVATPQRVAGKLSEQQTSMMIKGVCTDAAQREQRIMEVLRMSSMLDDPFASKFGIKLNPQMMNVRGRVLPPPGILYQNHRAMPRDGSWRADQAKLNAPAAIPCYGVVSFVPKQNQKDLVDFCGSLMQQARQMGMAVAELMPASVFYVNESKDLHDAMESCIRECSSKGKKCALIIVPLPSKNTDVYSTVKTLGEKTFGVATQVVLQRNVRPPKSQTLGNILLKINVKLSGVNWEWVVDEVTKKYLVDQPTLVLGLDVTHPGPTDRRSPSIGAAVGNIDLSHGRFGASISVQKHSRECVVYLTEAIRERVDHFVKKTGSVPTRIVVYRDGVAEGQFEEILREEIKGIRSACNASGGGHFDPKITFIVVQKRHHTRFFCCNTGDQCGKGRNIPPGTVVDVGVTHPEQFDFYLCSHYGIQGTSRPAHYHVLRDDNKFTQDELQAISYQLCHMYARCTRSVSIPAPTYYAHLACARARNHLHLLIGDQNSDSMSDSGSSGVSSTASGEAEDLELAMREGVKILDPMLDTMYFC